MRCVSGQGGRVASAVSHEQPGVTLGCIFFSYPLHPPKKTVSRSNPVGLQTMVDQGWPKLTGEIPQWLTFCVGMQSQLRDNPLTALTSPTLFVRGTNDAFCEHEQFETVKARMTSSDVQVRRCSITWNKLLDDNKH